MLSTTEFDAWEKLLPKDYRRPIENFISRLKEDITLGKPLGYPFFREKKIDKYRVYFLVYEDVTTVLLITISDKKAQQQTIDNIKSQLDFYKELIKKKINAL